MPFDRAGGVDHGRQATVGGPEVPLFKINRRAFRIALRVQMLEGEPDMVGARGLQCPCGQGVQCRALAFGKRIGVAQPDIPGAFQCDLFLLFRAPYLIDCVIDDFHRVEFVESDLGVGQMFRRALDEGGAHVDADLGDLIRIAAMFSQIGGEGRDGRGILAFGDVNHSGLVDIDEQRDVIVTATGSGFVDRDTRHGRSVGSRAGFLHVMMDDPP